MASGKKKTRLGITLPKGIQIQFPRGYEKPLGFGSPKTINLTKLCLAIHGAEALEIVEVTFLVLLHPVEV